MYNKNFVEMLEKAKMLNGQKPKINDKVKKQAEGLKNNSKLKSFGALLTKNQQAGFTQNNDNQTIVNELKIVELKQTIINEIKSALEQTSKKATNKTSEKTSKKKDPFVSSLGPGRLLPIRKGDTVTDVVTKLYNLLKKSYDDKLKSEELARDFAKDRKSKEEKRHNEFKKSLMVALGGRTGAGGGKGSGGGNDPFDFLSAGLTVGKKSGIKTLIKSSIKRLFPKLAAKFISKEAAKLASEEAAKFTSKEAAKLAAEEAAKLAAEEAAKNLSAKAAKTRLFKNIVKLETEEAAKLAAEEAAKKTLSTKEAKRRLFKEVVKLEAEEAAKLAAEEAAKKTLSTKEAKRRLFKEVVKLEAEEAAKLAAEEAAKKVLTRTATKQMGDLSKRALAKNAPKIVETATKVTGKEVVSKGLKASIKKFAGKLAFKTLTSAPALSFLVGTAYAIGKGVQGDMRGAALELGSGALGSIPIAGAVLGPAADVAIAVRDVYMDMYKTDPTVDAQKDPEGTKEKLGVIQQALMDYFKPDNPEGLPTDKVGKILPAKQAAAQKEMQPVGSAISSGAKSFFGGTQNAGMGRGHTATPKPPAVIPATPTPVSTTGSKIGQVAAALTKENNDLNLASNEEVLNQPIVVNSTKTTGSTKSSGGTVNTPISIRNKEDMFSHTTSKTVRVV